MDDPTRVARLRRKAQRQGLKAEKVRRMDPLALDYGTWQIVRADTGEVVAKKLPDGYGLSLDEVEEAITTGRYR